MDTSSQLDALRTSSGFASLSRYTKAFDLFRVMGVSSKELVHSNILAALMDERDAHGMGALFRDAYVVSLGQLPCITHQSYRTRDEARADLFDYIERFHNPRMRRRVARQDLKFSALFKPSVDMG